jgi:hypothetical protein
LRAASGANEQTCAEFFFQFLDGARQRRLVDVQALGSAGEVEFFGHGHKAAEMAKLHESPLLTGLLVHWA